MTSTATVIRDPISGLMVESQTCGCGRQFAPTPCEWSPALGFYSDMNYCPTCRADGTVWRYICSLQPKGKRR